MDSEVIIAVALPIAFGMYILLERSRRNYLRIPELPADGTVDDFDYVVVIPARNDRENLERLLPTLKGASVVVVEGEPDDGTAEAARSAGASVITTPPGKGRAAACWAGACATRSHWLLFVNPGVRLEREFIPSLLTQAKSDSIDLLTVSLRPELESWAERAVLPYVRALVYAGLDVNRVHSPASPDTPAGGECMLFRREAYNFIGGHAALRADTAGHLAIVRLAKRHRLNVRLMRAERLGSVRMFGSFRPLWRNLCGTLYPALKANPRQAAWATVVFVVCSAWLPVSVALMVHQYWPAALSMFALPVLLMRFWYGNYWRSLAAVAAIPIFFVIALMMRKAGDSDL